MLLLQQHKPVRVSPGRQKQPLADRIRNKYQLPGYYPFRSLFLIWHQVNGTPAHFEHSSITINLKLIIEQRGLHHHLNAGKFLRHSERRLANHGIMDLPAAIEKMISQQVYRQPLASRTNSKNSDTDLSAYYSGFYKQDGAAGWFDPEPDYIGSLDEHLSQDSFVSKNSHISRKLRQVRASNHIKRAFLKKPVRAIPVLIPGTAGAALLPTTHLRPEKKRPELKRHSLLSRAGDLSHQRTKLSRVNTVITLRNRTGQSLVGHVPKNQSQTDSNIFFSRWYPKQIGTKKVQSSLVDFGINLFQDDYGPVLYGLDEGYDFTTCPAPAQNHYYNLQAQGQKQLFSWRKLALNQLRQTVSPSVPGSLILREAKWNQLIQTEPLYKALINSQAGHPDTRIKVYNKPVQLMGYSVERLSQLNPNSRRGIINWQYFQRGLISNQSGHTTENYRNEMDANRFADMHIREVGTHVYPVLPFTAASKEVGRGLPSWRQRVKHKGFVPNAIAREIIGTGQQTIRWTVGVDTNPSDNSRPQRMQVLNQFNYLKDYSLAGSPNLLIRNMLKPNNSQAGEDGLAYLLRTGKNQPEYWPWPPNNNIREFNERVVRKSLREILKGISASAHIKNKPDVHIKLHLPGWEDNALTNLIPFKRVISAVKGRYTSKPQPAANSGSAYGLQSWTGYQLKEPGYSRITSQVLASSRQADKAYQHRGYQDTGRSNQPYIKKISWIQPSERSLRADNTKSINPRTKFQLAFMNDPDLSRSYFLNSGQVPEIMRKMVVTHRGYAPSIPWNTEKTNSMQDTILNSEQAPGIMRKMVVTHRGYAPSIPWNTEKTNPMQDTILNSGQAPGIIRKKVAPRRGYAPSIPWNTEKTNPMQDTILNSGQGPGIMRKMVTTRRGYAPFIPSSTEKDNVMRESFLSSGRIPSTMRKTVADINTYSLYIPGRTGESIRKFKGISTSPITNKPKLTGYNQQPIHKKNIAPGFEKAKGWPEWAVRKRSGLPMIPEHTDRLLPSGGNYETRELVNNLVVDRGAGPKEVAPIFTMPTQYARVQSPADDRNGLSQNIWVTPFGNPPSVRKTGFFPTGSPNGNALLTTLKKALMIPPTVGSISKMDSELVNDQLEIQPKTPGLRVRPDLDGKKAIYFLARPALVLPFKQSASRTNIYQLRPQIGGYRQRPGKTDVQNQHEASGPTGTGLAIPAAPGTLLSGTFEPVVSGNNRFTSRPGSGADGTAAPRFNNHINRHRLNSIKQRTDIFNAGRDTRQDLIGVYSSADRALHVGQNSEFVTATSRSGLFKHKSVKAPADRYFQTYTALAAGPALNYRQETSASARANPTGSADSTASTLNAELKLPLSSTGSDGLSTYEIKKIADRVYRDVQQRMKTERQRRGL